VYDIFCVRLRDGRPVGRPFPVTNDQKSIGGLAWTPDSRWIVFSSNRGGIKRLWRIEPGDYRLVEHGGQPEVVSGGVGEEATEVAVSLRGHRLAYVKAPQVAAMWRIKKPGSPAERPEPTPFAPSTLLDSNPRYSPDGRRVTFASSRFGGLEIWVCDAEGADLRQLTTLGTTGSPNWSHDGQSVVFDSRTSGRSAIWVVGREGGRPERITHGPEDMVPSWSPDGEWIYFNSARGGRNQIYRVRARGGQERDLKQLTTKQGGLGPVGSEDGEWVYYVVPGEPISIWKVSLKTGEEVSALELPKGSGLRDWTLARDGIYYLAPDDPAGPTFRFFGFADRTSKVIARLAKGSFERVLGCRVSPNGEWILFEVPSAPRDIMLVENFR
jgi:Tol biopolymer transport system component